MLTDSVAGCFAVICILWSSHATLYRAGKLEQLYVSAIARISKKEELIAVVHNITCAVGKVPQALKTKRGMWQSYITSSLPKQGDQFTHFPEKCEHNQ